MTRPRKAKLRNRLRREIVHEAIRAQIVSGALPAGTPLSEVQLAVSLKASRTPVREALMQLSEEGLLEMHPRRGPVVRHLLPGELTELLMVREAVEVLAVQLCVTRMPQAQLKELLAEWLEIQRNLSETTQDAVFAKCEEFHQQLVEGAQSKIINKMIGTIRDRISSARQLYLRPNEGHASMDLLKRSCAEHLKIIRAMLAKDVEQCSQLIERICGVSHARSRREPA